MQHALAPCQRCESALEHGDLRCPVCGLAAPEPEAATRRELEVKLLRCRGCGAALGWDARVQAPRCAFCDSQLELESVADPLEQAEAWLPFRLDRERAIGALGRWLGSQGFFSPSDLKARARLAELKPLWWVGWVFDATALVSWAADSDAGSGRAGWAPHAGQLELELDDILVSASRGLSDHETRELAPSYDLASALARPEGVDGATLEQFDMQRSGARQRVIETLQRMLQDTVSQRVVPGRKVRNLSLQALLKRLVTRRLGLPAWVLVYHYRDEAYRVVINGQDADCVVGQAPTSTLKVVLTTLAFAAALLLALLLLSG